MIKFVKKIAPAGYCLLLLAGCSQIKDQKESVQTLFENNYNQNNFEKSKIVNGEPVADEDLVAKSTVAIYLEDKEQTGGVKNICTGTLITNNIVLSAAHCFKDVAEVFLKIPLNDLIKRIRIGFGTQIVKSISDPRVTFIKVKKLTIHPGYARNMVRHAKRIPMPDLSMILLESNSPETSTPALLGINRLDLIQSGTLLTLAGYGLTSGERQSQASQLMKVDINIDNPTLTSAQFSYKVVNNKSACMGDSGGPAYFKNETGELIVIGVTSWGDNTCSSIGVYTNIPAFSEFISKSIEDFNQI